MEMAWRCSRDTPMNPVYTPCFHIFCKECLAKCVSRYCPNCREEFNRRQVIVARAAAEMAPPIKAVAEYLEAKDGTKRKAELAAYTAKLENDWRECAETKARKQKQKRKQKRTPNRQAQAGRARSQVNEGQGPQLADHGSQGQAVPELIEATVAAPSPGTATEAVQPQVNEGQGPQLADHGRDRKSVV